MMPRSFLDTIPDLSPADQALMLARCLGEIIRAGADDRDDRREAVDALLVIIERLAGLRL